MHLVLDCNKETVFEGEFCPVTCTMKALEIEIAHASTEHRKVFLEGVRHTRIIVSAATNGAFS